MLNKTILYRCLSSSIDKRRVSSITANLRWEFEYSISASDVQPGGDPRSIRASGRNVTSFWRPTRGSRGLELKLPATSAKVTELTYDSGEFLEHATEKKGYQESEFVC